MGRFEQRKVNNYGTVVTPFGTVDISGWIKMPSLSDLNHAEALRIAAEQAAQASGEPYGEGGDTSNGTVGERSFACWSGLAWTGGVTVPVPRSIRSDVGTDVQVFTSPALSADLIVHQDELIDGQRWVHLVGVYPDIWFTGWLAVDQILGMWPMLQDDRRKTGGKRIPHTLKNSPKSWRS